MKVRNNKILTSVITLMSGSLLAQLFTLIVTPFMARLFTPEEIGFNTLLLTYVTMFGPILSLKFEIPIVSEKEIKLTHSLGKLSFFIMFMMSSLISLFYSLYYFYYEGVIKVFIYFVIMFVMLFTTGLNNLIVSYNNRNAEYGFITKIYVWRNFVKNFLILFLGILNTGRIGLILSNVISQLVAMKKQIASLKTSLTEIVSSDFESVKIVFLKYKKQMYFSAPAAFCNSFSYSSINVFIKSLYGLEQLGYYSMSFLILGMPLSLISSNVSKVYFEEASKEFNQKGEYRSTFKKISLILSVLSIIMTMGMYFIVPYLLSFILGSQWKIAGVFIKILSPMFGIRFIVSSLSFGATISQKQGLDFFIQIFFILSNVLVFIISKQFNIEISNYLLLISILFSIIYIIYYFYLFNISKGKSRC